MFINLLLVDEAPYRKFMNVNNISSRIFHSKKTNFVEIFVENACSMLSLIENLAAASNYLTIILSYQNQKHNLQTS